MSPLRIIQKGKKDPVLYIHGLGGNAGIWEQVADKTGSSLIVELYGHGEQSHFPPQLSIQHTAADLYTYLKGHKYSGLRVVGQGLGGLIALELAHRNPAMVRELSLLDTPTWQTGWKIAQRLMLHVVRDDFARSVKHHMESLCRNEAHVEKLIAMGQAVQPRAWYLYLRDMFARDFRPYLDKIKVPVQVIITGSLAHNERKLLKILSRFAYEDLENLLVVGMPQQGHFPMLEEPGELAAHLEKFWRDVKA